MAIKSGITTQTYRALDYSESISSRGVERVEQTKVYTGWVYQREVNGTVTPGYVTKLRNGDLLPRNYFRDYQITRSGAIDSLRTTLGSDWAIIQRVIRPVISWPEVDAGLVIDWSTADLAMLKKLKGASWQAGVAWAEARKTSDLILTTATRMSLLIRSMKRLHFDQVGEILGIGIKDAQRARWQKAYGRNPRDAVATMLLETSYGWLPLLSDAAGAARALARVFSQPRSTLVKLSVSTGTEKYESNASHQYSNSPPRYVSRNRYTGINYRMVIAFQPDVTVGNLQSVGLLNPLETLYEVTPWSFLVDYFTTLGDVISVLDATTGKSFVWGTRSYRGYQTTEWTGPRGEDLHTQLSGSFLWVVRDKERRAMTAFPSTPLPQWRPNLGPVRISNMIALLQKQLSGITPLGELPNGYSRLRI